MLSRRRNDVMGNYAAGMRDHIWRDPESEHWREREREEVDYRDALAIEQNRKYFSLRLTFFCPIGKPFCVMEFKSIMWDGLHFYKLLFLSFMSFIRDS